MEVISQFMVLEMLPYLKTSDNGSKIIILLFDNGSKIIILLFEYTWGIDSKSVTSFLIIGSKQTKIYVGGLRLT